MVRIPIKGWITKNHIPSCDMSHKASLQSVGVTDQVSIKVAYIPFQPMSTSLFTKFGIFQNPMVFILVFHKKMLLEIRHSPL